MHYHRIIQMVFPIETHSLGIMLPEQVDGMDQIVPGSEQTINLRSILTRPLETMRGDFPEMLKKCLRHKKRDFSISPLIMELMTA